MEYTYAKNHSVLIGNSNLTGQTVFYLAIQPQMTSKGQVPAWPHASPWPVTLCMVGSSFFTGQVGRVFVLHLPSGWGLRPSPAKWVGSSFFTCQVGGVFVLHLPSGRGLCPSPAKWVRQPGLVFEQSRLARPLWVLPMGSQTLEVRKLELGHTSL